MKKKLIIIGHRYHLQKQMGGVYDALEEQFDLKKIFVDDGWPLKISDIQEYNEYAACIWFVRFRELILKPDIDWCDYKGIRIMYDWDVHANYHQMIGGKYLGMWPNVFRRNNFHLLITTGKECKNLLKKDNIPAYWLPKAYGKSLFLDLGGDREGISHFGNPYLARRAMMEYLKKEKIKFTHFKCVHKELNTELNKYLGCLVCNMSGVFTPVIGRLINKAFPYRGINLEHGIEAMQKNFEVAASGCAPIIDWIEELDDLGFEDGKTAVIYNSFDELTEKLKYYEQHPQALRTIGKNAAQLATEKHTWNHRALELEKVIENLETTSK